jgi:hypothetical protein
MSAKAASLFAATWAAIAAASRSAFAVFRGSLVGLDLARGGAAGDRDFDLVPPSTDGPQPYPHEAQPSLPAFGRNSACYPTYATASKRLRPRV